MKLTEIRKNFLKYFDSKDHEIISSSDLIPHGDDSILFTNAVPVLDTHDVESPCVIESDNITKS